MLMNIDNTRVTRTPGVRKLPDNLEELLGLFYRNLDEIKTLPLCSHFRTFALIESESGNIYTGTNVEGWNFLNCWCAERAAISELARHEDGHIRSIIIGSHHPHLILTPGGPCREMILDFSNEHTLIVMPSKREVLISTAWEMYPYPSPYRVRGIPFDGSRANAHLIKKAETVRSLSMIPVEAYIRSHGEYSEIIELASKNANAAIALYYGLKSATVIQCELGKAYGVSMESLEYCSSSASCKNAVANALASRSQLGRMLRMVTIDQFSNVLPPMGETRQLLADENEEISRLVKDLKILVVDYSGSGEVAEVSISDLMPYPSRIN